MRGVSGAVGVIECLGPAVLGGNRGASVSRPQRVRLLQNTCAM